MLSDCDGQLDVSTWLGYRLQFFTQRDMQVLHFLRLCSQTPLHANVVFVFNFFSAFPFVIIVFISIIFSLFFPIENSSTLQVKEPSFRYQAFDLVYLLLSSKQVCGRFIIILIVQVRKLVLELLTIMSRLMAEPLRNCFFTLLYSLVLLISHYLFLVDKGICELWESISFHLVLWERICEKIQQMAPY